MPTSWRGRVANALSSGGAALAAFSPAIVELVQRVTHDPPRSSWATVALAVGVCVTVALAVGLRLRAPGLVALLLLPFAASREATVLLSGLGLGSALMLVAAHRRFAVANASRTRVFRLICAGGLAGAAVGLLVLARAPSWQLLSPALGMLVLGGLSARRAEPPDELAIWPACGLGAAAFALSSAVVLAAILLQPLVASALSAFGHRGAAPASRSAVWRAESAEARTSATAPAPTALSWLHRAELEPADDPRVREDSQNWCRYRAPSVRTPFFRPRTRRWKLLDYDYGRGDADAACEIEQRLRAVLAEHSACTPLLVSDAGDECARRRR